MMRSESETILKQSISLRKVESPGLKSKARSQNKVSKSRTYQKHKGYNKKNHYRNSTNLDCKISNRKAEEIKSRIPSENITLKILNENSECMEKEPVGDVNRYYLSDMSHKMESQPSQETQVTELRMESIPSQDDLLKSSGKASLQPTVSAGWDLGKTSKLATMASQASTEVDPFRSSDCLILHNNVPTMKRENFALRCVNCILQFMRGLTQQESPLQTKKSVFQNGEIFGRARLSSSFRGEGRVTTGCLWHACRAVTIGIFLVITGVALTVIGQYFNQINCNQNWENGCK